MKNNIEIIQPKNGEVWAKGSWHVIAWKCPSKITVEYSIDSGLSWNVLQWDKNNDLLFSDRCVNLPNNFGRVLWKVPKTAEKKCLIKFRSDELQAEDHPIREIEIIESQEKRYQWENVLPNAPFAPRDGAGALVFKNKMWLFGGWNPQDQINFPNDCNSEVWSSRDGRMWELVNCCAPWEKRHTAGWVVHDGKMWLLGGDCIQGHYQSDVWNTEDGISWKKISGSPPWGERVLHYVASHHGRMWVMGGQKVTAKLKSHIRWDGPTEEICYNDVWSSEDGITWRMEMEHAPWQPRGEIGGNAVKDEFVWLIGGGIYYERYYPEVWRTSNGCNWENILRFAPWYPRYYHEVAVFDDRLWILGGITESNRADTWYSSDGLNWYECSNVSWPPRHASSVFVFENSLWVVAGNKEGNACRNDIWRLSI